MHALKVRHLWLVARFHEYFKACTDQGGDASTEHGLLAKEVGFGLFSDGSAQHTCAGTANGACVCQGDGLGIARCILLNGPESGNADSLGEEAAHHMTRAFGRYHGDVDFGRRYDLRIMQAKTVCRHERLPRSQSRCNIALKYLTMVLIGDEYHDDIGLLCGSCRCHHLKALGLGLLAALAARG